MYIHKCQLLVHSPWRWFVLFHESTSELNFYHTISHELELSQICDKFRLLSTSITSTISGTGPLLVSMRTLKFRIPSSLLNSWRDSLHFRSKWFTTSMGQVVVWVRNDVVATSHWVLAAAKLLFLSSVGRVPIFNSTNFLVDLHRLLIWRDKSICAFARIRAVFLFLFANLIFIRVIDDRRWKPLLPM